VVFRKYLRGFIAERYATRASGFFIGGQRLHSMSALPPKADIPRRPFHIRFGPEADIQEFGSHQKKTPGPTSAHVRVMSLYLQ
jgi:hypothetical protein